MRPISINFSVLRNLGDADEGSSGMPNSCEFPVVVVTALLSFRPPPTHQDLAGRIGSQREAVSKELRRLEKDGVIMRGRAAIPN